MALRRSAFLLCGDWHLADDLVQTTLIKLHDPWPRICRRHQPVSYARKVLLRCWLDERRRPWRRVERRDGDVPDGADPAAGPAVLQDVVALRAELFALLGALSLVHARARLDLGNDPYADHPRFRLLRDKPQQDSARIRVYEEFTGESGALVVIRFGTDGTITEVSTARPDEVAEPDLIALVSDPALRFPLPR